MFSLFFAAGLELLSVQTLPVRKLAAIGLQQEARTRIRQNHLDIAFLGSASLQTRFIGRSVVTTQLNSITTSQPLRQKLRVERQSFFFFPRLRLQRMLESVSVNIQHTGSNKPDLDVSVPPFFLLPESVSVLFLLIPLSMLLF